MSLSKRHLSTRGTSLEFDPDKLGAAIRERCPEVVFCLLHGSARDGEVAVGSDIDLALYTIGKPTPDLLGRVVDAVEEHAPGVHADIGFLNRGEPVYGFEALKGRLLFSRDPDRFHEFFSQTCRRYEFQLADYARQHRYRMERS